MKLFLLVLLALASVLPGLAQDPIRVKVEVQDRGTVVIELYPKEAPKTVAHFVKLIEDKFYDGMLFHRKVDGFVVQAGDPETKKLSVEDARAKPGEMGGTKGYGSGGSGTTIPFETNALSHVKGTIGMALSAPKSDTGDSQFFINLADNTRLDGNYVVFGKVVDGWDIVEKIQRADRIVKMTVEKAG